jgi:chorismate--pyruvate lyase
VRVQVLNNTWQRSFISESRLLKLPQAKYSLTREVLLLVDDTPLVLARTILPKRTIQSKVASRSKLAILNCS